MDNTPLSKKPWFYIAAWLTVLLVAYGWQIVRMGGFIASEVDIFVDLACIFPLLLVLWMAFFAQFVLPVRSAADRQKIFDRLITYLFGGHGPAMFIRDGILIKREGEEQKRGPGVLWLDSASAAVIRTSTAIKRTIGPGVHFIENKEFIAGIVDLHEQNQSVGPKESDKPFDAKKEGQSDEEYNQIQDRRKQVSAWTRNGIEVVPNITVRFRVDTGFPKEGQPGSRFGFRTGVTKKDKDYEKQDKKAVEKAILGEGINPNAQPDSPRHRVAWNQLPAVLAVDLWREYAAKFTLDELFKPDQVVLIAPPTPPHPSEEEFDPLSQPVQVSPNRETMKNTMTKVLRFINLRMDWMIKRLEGKSESKPPILTSPSLSMSLFSGDKGGIKTKTALQVISDMVTARLTQPEVDILDDTGLRGEGTIHSKEFDLLKDRGLKVISVSISNPRFNPTVEESIIKTWNATWLNAARAESEQIDRRRNIVEKTAEEKAKRQYADTVSREINELAKKGKPEVKDVLKALILKSHSIILNNEELRRRMTTELQDIEEMVKWVEANGK